MLKEIADSTVGALTGDFTKLPASIALATANRAKLREQHEAARVRSLKILHALREPHAATALERELAEAEAEREFVSARYNEASRALREAREAYAAKWLVRLEPVTAKARDEISAATEALAAAVDPLLKADRLALDNGLPTPRLVGGAARIRRIVFELSSLTAVNQPSLDAA